MKSFLPGFFAFMLGIGILLAGCGLGTAKSEANSPCIARTEPVKAGAALSGQGAASNAAKAPQVTRIKLIFDGGEAVAELYDNPTSRDLVSMLPLTLSFEDFNGTEKIAYPPRSLSTEQAPEGIEPLEGELTLYAPWGNLAIFYQDFRYSQGLVPIGYLTSGLEKLAKMNGGFNVRIEAVNK